MENVEIVRSVNTAFYEKLIEKMWEARDEALACARRMGVHESLARTLVDNVIHDAQVDMRQRVKKSS